MGLLCVLSGLMAWYALSVRGGLTAANLVNLLDWSRYWAIPGIVAVPMTLIIATRGIDLSVASMLALAGMTLGAAWQSFGMNIWAAAALGIMTAVVAGTSNGCIITRMQLAPLVVTLASMAAYRGLATGITRAQPVTGIPPALDIVGQARFLGVPAQVYVWAAVVLTGGVVLHRTWIGMAILAIGESPRAARFAALPVDGILTGLYTASGLAAGVAAVIYVAQYTGANPNMEMGLELKAIACVVLGGTRITGGNASILGTTLGVLIIGMLEYNLDLIEFPKKYHPVVIGCVVIVSAVLNEAMARRSRNHV
jgi:rhamnose transport system permease protein